MKRKNVSLPKLFCTGILGGSILFNSIAFAAIRGDVNNDGNVDKADRDLLVAYIQKKTRNINIANADMDGNGKITATDLSALTQMIRKNANTLKGDVNGDGRVDLTDSSMVQQYTQKMLSSLPCPQNADVDSDGKITMDDARALLSMYTNTIRPNTLYLRDKLHILTAEEMTNMNK